MYVMTNDEILLGLVQSGQLQVDAEGRIWRAMKRSGNRWTGGVDLTPCAPTRAEWRSRQGYLVLSVMVNGKRISTGAHRLVWMAANGQIPEGQTINHINGVKDDNRIANLDLATMSEQRNHAIAVLNVDRRHPKGSLHPKTKLTEADVLEIRRLRQAGWMVKEIAAKYEMKTRAISAICNRRTWPHI